jgi:hypothetical protein
MAHGIIVQSSNGCKLCPHTEGAPDIFLPAGRDDLRVPFFVALADSRRVREQY